jgi:hypothetical protein
MRCLILLRSTIQLRAINRRGESLPPIIGREPFPASGRRFCILHFAFLIDLAFRIIFQPPRFLSPPRRNKFLFFMRKMVSINALSGIKYFLAPP